MRDREPVVSLREAGLQYAECLYAWFEEQDITAPGWGFTLGLRAAFDHPEWAQWVLQRCEEAKAGLASPRTARVIVEDLAITLHALDDPLEVIPWYSPEEAVG